MLEGTAIITAGYCSHAKSETGNHRKLRVWEAVSYYYIAEDDSFEKIKSTASKFKLFYYNGISCGDLRSIIDNFFFAEFN